MDSLRQDASYWHGQEEAKGYPVATPVKVEEPSSPPFPLTKVIKQRQNRCRDKELQGMNIGHWTRQEKRLYFLFLYEHQSHFFNREMRRLDKIFKAMATFIGTRAADQCRSHHQKVEKKYHTFQNILNGLKEHYEEERLPVKVEGEGNVQRLGLLDDSDEDLPRLDQLPPTALPSAVKFEPVYPARSFEQTGLENDWNMTEGLDQLHYL